MPAKRDFVAEIVRKRERTGSPSPWELFETKIGELKRAWTAQEPSDAATPDFFLIRAITIIEAFTKRSIAVLADHGEPFADRAITLAEKRSIKLDFELFRGLHGRRITLGEVLAHGVKVSDMSSVCSVFEAMLDKPLRVALEGVLVPPNRRRRSFTSPCCRGSRYHSQQPE